MDETEIRTLANKVFGEKYPEDTAVTATEVIREVFGGALAVIRSVEKNEKPDEELAYIYPDKTVRIFDTTEQMARFLEVQGAHRRHDVKYFIYRRDRFHLSDHSHVHRGLLRRVQ